MEQLILFFSKIREITFWQRVFSWRKIRTLSYEAFEEFKTLENVEKKLNRMEGEMQGLELQVAEFKRSELKKDTKIDQLQRDLDSSNGVVQQYKATDEGRTSSYREGITQVNQLKRTLEGEISRLNDERVQEKEETFEKMKGQWAEHEVNIKQSIKMICQMHLIKYINNVPFKGSPDNTIEICDEFVIFDSKSPANNDLSNFPKYIRLQTETVKKYANQENVKKDIYLVVPTNTIHTLTKTTFNMGDYNVYIITKDSLEPIILSLKRIEDYEFVKQLTPEERDNICRVIGRFAHTTKRKIQIDQFFANQFLELLIKCKDDLPEDILKEVIAYEKAEKLNPPVDKKEKQILIRELQDNNELINSEAAIRGVPIPLNFNEVKRLE